MHRLTNDVLRERRRRFYRDAPYNVPPLSSDEFARYVNETGFGITKAKANDLFARSVDSSFIREEEEDDEDTTTFPSAVGDLVRILDQAEYSPYVICSFMLPSSCEEYYFAVRRDVILFFIYEGVGAPFFPCSRADVGRSRALCEGDTFHFTDHGPISFKELVYPPSHTNSREISHVGKLMEQLIHRYPDRAERYRIFCTIAASRQSINEAICYMKS
jgi:hypothetical protein